MSSHSLVRSHFILNTSEKMKTQQYDLLTLQKPIPSPTTFLLKTKGSLKQPGPDDEFQGRERSHLKKKIAFLRIAAGVI